MNMDLSLVPDMKITHLEPGHVYILTLPDFCTVDDMDRFMLYARAAMDGIENPPILMISTHSAEVQHVA